MFFIEGNKTDVAQQYSDLFAENFNFSPKLFTRLARRTCIPNPAKPQKEDEQIIPVTTFVFILLLLEKKDGERAPRLKVTQSHVNLFVKVLQEILGEDYYSQVTLAEAPVAFLPYFINSS